MNPQDMLSPAEAGDYLGIAKSTLERAAQRLPIVSDRDDEAQGRPATWRLRPGFASRVSPQDGVRRNIRCSDQGERPESEGFASSSEIEAKPRRCSTCGGAEETHEDALHPFTSER
jgi:hypothetical protein